MKNAINFLPILIMLILSNLSFANNNTESTELKLFWNSKRTDNFTTPTKQGERAALAGGYRFARVEGYVLTEKYAKTLHPSLVKPLKLYWSKDRTDNFTTATKQGERAALAGGYRFARVEGYVYTKQITGTRPLKLFWNSKRKDNFTTATKAGERVALAGGYKFVRIQGYVKAAPPASDNISGRINLPDHLRPSFENVPVWRLQLRIKTSNRENANTDSEVYAQFRNNTSSIYYLDNGGNDREKNKTDVYDILDPNIKTIRDIQFMKLVIKGKDGWCVEKIELIVNGINNPVFKKSFANCHWMDKDSGASPNLYISGSELRRASIWRHTTRNKAIWLPPSIIKRYTLEKMVESYVGHLMNANPKMKDLEYGKKFGRAYVEAKKTSNNKLHFDLDLVYHKVVDLETDVDFDLVINCQQNKINLKVQGVKAKLNVPLLSTILSAFQSGLFKMDMGNFEFGNANVPFCPTIKVTPQGDVSLRL